MGGATLSRGRVEYCYDGSWYSLCAKYWDEEEARVVCNTLGYDTTDHGINTCTSLNFSLHAYSESDFFLFQCQLYPNLVEVQAPFSRRVFSVQAETTHLVIVPEQITSQVIVSM